MYRICFTVDPYAELRIVKSHCDVYMKSLLDRVGCNQYIALLGIHGSNNTKYDIFPEYKRGRPTDKPPHWNLVMNYLVSKWGFTCISGCEVDDAVRFCYETTPAGEESVIVSSDKDLLQIPGNHFVMGVSRKGKIVRKDEVRKVQKIEGERKFYQMMLTGDMTDNVRGIYGIGPKTAERILALAANPLEMRLEVMAQYKQAFGEDWETKFAINETLLRVNGDYAREVGFERPRTVSYKVSEQQEYSTDQGY
jgi:5'-3' exonuclease